jgi:hypothetical protein
MIDGDVTHLSEVKLVALWPDVGGGVVCISISFRFISLLSTSCAFIVFLNQWGPEWENPPLRRRTIGDNFLFYFFAVCIVFRIFGFWFMLGFYFCSQNHYGRQTLTETK